MSYIASHLAHYNTVLTKFVAGDHVASLGDTGWADGIHLHLQDVPGARTISDFYRSNCKGRVVRPNIEAMLDMSVYGITLEFMALYGDTYYPGHEHFGIDATHTQNERLGIEQPLIFKVPIEIIERGKDDAFGNYIIFEVLWGQVNQPTPPPIPQAPQGQLYVNLQPQAGLVSIFKNCDKASGLLSEKVGALNPEKFGGLTYTALEINDAGTGHRNVVIETESFGSVWLQMDYDYRDLLNTQSYTLIK